MAINLALPVSGLVVAITETPYEVTDQDTGQKNSGLTRIAYIVTDFEESVTDVKFKADAVAEFERIKAAGQFATVNMTVAVKQYSNRAAFLQFSSLQAVEPVKSSR